MCKMILVRSRMDGWMDVVCGVQAIKYPLSVSSNCKYKTLKLVGWIGEIQGLYLEQIFKYLI